MRDRVSLAETTLLINGTTCRRFLLGNIFEAYAALLVGADEWAELAGLLRARAREDTRGLAASLAPRPGPPPQGEGPPGQGLAGGL